MQPFFSPRKLWPGGGPYPHFIIELGGHPGFTAFARGYREYLAPCAGALGIVPDEWLHATVQGIFQPAGREQMEQLGAAARRELAGMAAFDVEAGPARVGQTAVTVYLYPKDGMAELAGRLRAAAGSVPGIALRPPDGEFFAHATLAYSRLDWDARQLDQSVKAEPVRRASITAARPAGSSLTSARSPSRPAWRR